MKNGRMIVAAVALTASLAVIGSGSAQASGHAVTAGGHKYTVQQVAASDQTMQRAIGALQAASTAMKGTDVAPVRTDLNAAYGLIMRAGPIYRGNREAAAKDTAKVLKALPRSGTFHFTPHMNSLVASAIKYAHDGLMLH